MQLELDEVHAKMLLRTQTFGRLGCSIRDRPYIVPVSYVYDEGFIYCHTNDGQKLRMMRENPAVCFEVDEIGDFRRWRCVICRGRFEELHGENAARALNIMIGRLTPLPDGPRASDAVTQLDDVAHQIKLKSLKGATFRIHVEELSGRMERL